MIPLSLRGLARALFSCCLFDAYLKRRTSNAISAKSCISRRGHIHKDMEEDAEEDMQENLPEIVQNLLDMDEDMDVNDDNVDMDDEVEKDVGRRHGG